MNKLVVVLVGLVVCIPLVYTVAFGYTSADLTRDSTSDVVSDPQGIISLQPNNSFELIQTNAQGELTIRTENLNSGADSLNRETTLEIGNTQDPASQPAFTATNLTGSQKTFVFSVTQTNANTAADPVTYIIDTQNGVETISLGDSVMFTVPSGSQVPVSIEVRSTGLVNGDEIHTKLVISGETS